MFELINVVRLEHCVSKPIFMYSVNTVIMKLPSTNDANNEMQQSSFYHLQVFKRNALLELQLSQFEIR